MRATGQVSAQDHGLTGWPVASVCAKARSSRTCASMRLGVDPEALPDQDHAGGQQRERHRNRDADLPAALRRRGEHESGGQRCAHRQLLERRGAHAARGHSYRVRARRGQDRGSALSRISSRGSEELMSSRRRTASAAGREGASGSPGRAAGPNQKRSSASVAVCGSITPLLHPAGRPSAPPTACATHRLTAAKSSLASRTVPASARRVSGERCRRRALAAEHLVEVPAGRQVERNVGAGEAAPSGRLGVCSTATRLVSRVTR